MGSVQKRGRSIFRARYRDPSGEQRSKTFATEREAKAFLATVESEKARGHWIDPRESKLPFEVYAAQWLLTKANVAPRTRINVEGRVRNHLVPFFGSRPIGAIQPVHVRSLIATLSGSGLAPSTVKATFLTLNQIMKTAEIDALIRRSPCIGIELPADTSDTEMVFLTKEQVASLAAAISPRFHVAIFTAAYTGLRAGELWALTVPKLNLLKPSMSVTSSVSELNGRLVPGPTKTRQNRTVSIPRFIAEMLAEQITRYPSPEGFLFTSERSGQIRHHNFAQRQFRKAVAAADVPSNLRFHDLRHACAAILIDGGWSLEQLKRHLGHSSIRVTSDRYAHLYEGHDDALLQRLDREFRASPPVASPWPGATITAIPDASQGTG